MSVCTCLVCQCLSMFGTAGSNVCLIYVHVHNEYTSPCFLCVFQLIARLKREIESLKEELAMVTGEQRDDQLTVEEIHTYVTSWSLIPPLPVLSQSLSVTWTSWPRVLSPDTKIFLTSPGLNQYVLGTHNRPFATGSPGV